jgi:hypothetical protein
MTRRFKRTGNVIADALIGMTEDHLDEMEEAGMNIDDCYDYEERESNSFDDWLGYNVIMTGRVPLIDEERGKD